LKKEVENSRVEEKVGVQSNIASFFGVQKDPSAKFQGSAQFKEFQGKEVDIWHWNINGLNAVLERGDLQSFLKKANPTILCLNEIKVDYEKMEKQGYHK
jgi:hypothetical protein